MTVKVSSSLIERAQKTPVVLVWDIHKDCVQGWYGGGVANPGKVVLFPLAQEDNFGAVARNNLLRAKLEVMRSAVLSIGIFADIVKVMWIVNDAVVWFAGNPIPGLVAHDTPHLVTARDLERRYRAVRTGLALRSQRLSRQDIVFVAGVVPIVNCVTVFADLGSTHTALPVLGKDKAQAAVHGTRHGQLRHSFLRGWRRRVVVGWRRREGRVAEAHLEHLARQDP